MSMTDDEIRSFYTDADEHDQARQLREHMAAIIREAMKDVAYELGGGDAPRGYYQHHADRTLETLLRVCNEKGWERIGRPIMAKIEAEHRKQAALHALALNSALNPMLINIPASLAALAGELKVAGGSPIQPVDE